MQTVLFCAPVVLVSGSNTVNNYENGGNIYIGDTDPEP